MDQVQEAVEHLHAVISHELETDPEMPGVLRACLLGIKKECEALDWAFRQVWTDTVAEETFAVNDRIDADWKNPDVQVNPNVPHPKPKAKAKKAAKKAEVADEALD